MSKNTIGIIVAIIVIVGGWYLLKGTPASAPEAAATETPAAPAAAGATSPAEVIVTYTDQGFSPANVSIAQGQTVTWVNQSSEGMWVASAAHPTHMVYDGTAESVHCATGYSGPAPFDECSAGASYSFTFDKAGTWKYHNHADAKQFGSVTVTAAGASAAL